MVRFICIILCCLLASSCSAKPPLEVRSPQQVDRIFQCVVLIHGLGRSSDAMSSIRDELVKEGYDTVNLDYDSTEKDIETIAREDFPPAVARCLKFSPRYIHFVTHSLGGIILRKAFSEKKPANLGRVVMLSPPNQGSELVDEIKDWWLFRTIMGPAGQQLGTGKNGLPAQLGRANFPLGIITGSRHSFFDSWFASVIPGEDDGKVSIQSARLEGMADFLVTEDSHPFIMDSENVQAQTIHFLQKGKFIHTGSPVEKSPQQDRY